MSGLASYVSKILGAPKKRWQDLKDTDVTSDAASVVRERLRNSLAPHYLTLISILQGALLAYVLSVATQPQVGWPLKISLVLIVITVWNEYRMGATLFLWIPHLWDSLIPFGLGIFQFLVIHSIKAEPTGSEWFKWLAALYGLAFVAYVYMYVRAYLDGTNAGVLKMGRHFLWINPVFSSGLALGFYGLYMSQAPIDNNWVAVAILVFLLKGELNWWWVTRQCRDVEKGGRPEHRPTPTQLDNMVCHVAYEAAALEASAKRFSESKDRFIMEAFLLHARLLREFIWGSWKDSKRFKHSSVYAEDYFTESLFWSDRKGTLPALLDETKDPIDKQLAHICRERADPKFILNLEEKIPQLQDELLEHWDRFVDQLGDDPRAELLKTAHSKWQKILESREGQG